MTSIKRQYETLQAKAREAGFEVRLCMAPPEVFADRTRFARLSEATVDLRAAIDAFAAILEDPDLAVATRHLQKARAIEAEAKPIEEQRDRLLKLAESILEEASRVEAGIEAKHSEVRNESIRGNGYLIALGHRHRLLEPGESVTFER